MNWLSKQPQKLAQPLDPPPRTHTTVNTPSWAEYSACTTPTLKPKTAHRHGRNSARSEPQRARLTCALLYISPCVECMTVFCKTTPSTLPVKSRSIALVLLYDGTPANSANRCFKAVTAISVMSLSTLLMNTKHAMQTPYN